jgi:hypothetical protein
MRIPNRCKGCELFEKFMKKCWYFNEKGNNCFMNPKKEEYQQMIEWYQKNRKYLVKYD